jgi:hypothetical protein
MWANPAFSDSATLPSSNPTMLTTETIKSKCIEFTGIKIGSESYEAADCRVSEFGSIGIFNNQTYYYAIYCLIPGHSIQNGKCGSDSFNAQYYKEQAMAIFINKGLSDEATLLMERSAEELGTMSYGEPELIVNSFGTFLYLPIHVQGTGAGNSSEYYFWDEKSKKWQKLETNSWTQNIKIPPGLSINKGIWPDLRKMTAEAYFYRSNDYNCCPTGGKAQIKLTIVNGRLSIKSATNNLENAQGNK